MRYNGHCTWPPVWTAARSYESVKGEVGILVLVHSNANISRRCHLVIDHENRTYVGTLLFDSHAFCERVVQVLKRNLQKTIKEIGDLEIADIV
jgi:hypothetical protein